MLKTAFEAAALIGVVAAVIAGSFYAMGTVAQLAYFHALGFDAHQFPTLGSELHLVGMVHVVVPALVIGVVALAYACMFALTDRAEDWLSRHPVSAKWRIPFGLVMLAVAAGVAYFSPPATTTTQWILGAIFVGVIILAGNLFGKWVAPVVMSFLVGGVMLALVVKYVTGQAYEAGKDRATAAGKSNATTIVELTDGSKILRTLLRLSRRQNGDRDLPGRGAAEHTIVPAEGAAPTNFAQVKPPRLAGGRTAGGADPPT